MHLGAPLGTGRASAKVALWHNVGTPHMGVPAVSPRMRHMESRKGGDLSKVDKDDATGSACRRNAGLLGQCASTGRPDVKYAHSRISQHMSAPKQGTLAAVVHAVKYCTSTMTACLFQPYGSEGEWRLTTGSDHAGNAEPQNKQQITAGAHGYAWSSAE